MMPRPQIVASCAGKTQKTLHDLGFVMTRKYHLPIIPYPPPQNILATLALLVS